MLKAMVERRLECWAVAELEGDEPTLHGFVVTRPVYDEFSDVWDLVVLSMYSFSNRMTDQIWVDGMATLCKYCEEKGFRDLVAFTKSKKIQKAFTELAGGNTDMVQCQVEARTGIRNLSKLKETDHG
jgi:hypothetical protein